MTDQIGNRKSAIGNREGWLRGRDLNPRPLGYEPNELPDCSTPRQINSSRRLIFGISNLKFEISKLVGLGRVELPTSRLSGVRSNQLSYRPLGLFRAILAQKRATLRFCRSVVDGGPRLRAV